MSVNKYTTAEGLVTLANGSRMWVGTKAAYDSAKQAGTMPNDVLVAITDDSQDNNYSTEEVLTGKFWIDGKPIYRKVFTGSASNGTKINHNISNLDKVINIDGTIESGNMWYPLTSYDQGYYTRPSIDTTEIWWVMQNFSNISYILIFEYTKTTET